MLFLVGKHLLSKGDFGHELISTSQLARRTSLEVRRATKRRASVPTRIYSLAKDLNIDGKKLVELCTKAGIQGKGSALASLEDDEVVKLKAFLEAGAAKQAAAPAS